MRVVRRQRGYTLAAVFVLLAIAIGVLAGWRMTVGAASEHPREVRESPFPIDIFSSSAPRLLATSTDVLLLGHPTRETFVSFYRPDEEQPIASQFVGAGGQVALTLPSGPIQVWVAVPEEASAAETTDLTLIATVNAPKATIDLKRMRPERLPFPREGLSRGRSS